MTVTEEPNYRAFLRDLQKLCRRHRVHITACDEGTVGVGPWGLKTIGEFAFHEIRVAHDGASLRGNDEKDIVLEP